MAGSSQRQACEAHKQAARIAAKKGQRSWLLAKATFAIYGSGKSMKKGCRSKAKFVTLAHGSGARLSPMMH